MFWFDRTKPRKRPFLHGNAILLRCLHRRIRPQRLQKLDHQQPHRRRIHRLGTQRRRQDQGIPRRKGHARPRSSKDRGQAIPPRQCHRNDFHGGRPRPSLPRTRRHRSQGTVLLSQQRAIRHRMGSAGSRRGLLPSRARVRHGTKAVRRAPRSQPIDSKEVGRYGDGHCPGAIGMSSGGTTHGKANGVSQHDLACEAQQLRKESGHCPYGT
mmetsp:Transcript_33703/g.70861  ORF Transcript_33703/g.70861 Transcript_33703/m.70861 type:complete len:211 (-) Transcript_33703:145-777(-)